MILVDTSVWIDHLRLGVNRLKGLLAGGRVLIHPFVLGEIACGNLHQREEVLALLSHLPRCKVADDVEVLCVTERHGLMGRGIGYIDAHLLTATVLSDAAQLWARDKRLAVLAQDMGCAYSPG